MERDLAASWRLPEVRRNRDRHLAQLFRDICYLDSCEGCFASNAWFERQVGVVESTIKRLLNVLTECGLVEVTILHGNERQIRPLVSLADVLTAGWKELCEAVLDRHKFPSALRRLAAGVLRRLGIRRGPNLSRLGCSVESESASFTGRKCAPPARGIAPPLSCRRERSGEDDNSTRSWF